MPILRCGYLVAGAPMKEGLKRLVGPRWQARVHRLSRLRWFTKLRNVRSFRGEAGPARRLAYVLTDPETESYSYEVANERELITGIAAALARSPREIAAYAAETHLDPELNGRLARHVRWRFDVKRHLPLGHRLVWYLLARALKPQLVVETGVYLGLGSLVLLRALERNRREGSPGELMSFDSDPRAGSIVREPLRCGWQRHVGLTHDLLIPALDGRRVGLFF